MPNIRLTLAYDGTDFCGWQIQSNGPSIQAAVERAIERLTGEQSAVLSAGRTDSGVHAIGQVASFHTQSQIPGPNWPAALQPFLPEAIVVREACVVPDTFHATFSARSKRYRYVIFNARSRLPFLTNYTYHVWKRLDAAAMHDAAQVLLGTHDFRSFETDWPNKASSVRTVMELNIVRCAHWSVWSQVNALPVGQMLPADAQQTVPPGAGDFICMDIVADGFLYNMVRSIMGTLINVGRGRWSAADLQRVLDAQSRSAAGSTAPACGLYLIHVDYGNTAGGERAMG